MDRGEFRVLFQPIVRLATGRLAGFEALLRWQRAERVWSPDEFLSVAEETGLILPVGSVVLREACRQARRWQKLLGADRVLPVSVNLSDKQFRDPALPTRIEAVLAETGPAAGRPAPGGLRGRDHRDARGRRPAPWPGCGPEGSRSTSTTSAAGTRRSATSTRFPWTA